MEFLHNLFGLIQELNLFYLRFDLIQTRLHAFKEGRWEYVLANYGPNGEAMIDIKLLLKDESGTPASKSAISGSCNTVNQTIEELGLRGKVQIRILAPNGKLVDDCRGTD